jgi:uncharacterized protein YhfF
MPRSRYPVLELAAPGPERDKGLTAIRDGRKTAMTGLPALFDCAGEPIPRVGDRFTVLDSDGEPALDIELTVVEIVRFDGVDDDYASAEGRGYRDAADWQVAHRAFFTSAIVCDLLGYAPVIEASTPVVLQRFRLLSAD